MSAGCPRCASTSTCRPWSTVSTPASICETSNGIPLPVDTIRRLCCEAAIIPVVLGADGEALAVGREQRVANRAQRRALRAMYRTCAHPHCDISFDHCQIHHVIPWERFGLTDLENLLPLCSKHHHLVHEGRWHLTLQPDRTITLHRPDGTHYFTGTHHRPATQPTEPTDHQRRPATSPTTRNPVPPPPERRPSHRATIRCEQQASPMAQRHAGRSSSDDGPGTDRADP